MSDNHGAACNRDSLLENFAAELTSAAYAVALRHGMEDDGSTWNWTSGRRGQRRSRSGARELLHFSDEPFVSDWIRSVRRRAGCSWRSWATVVKHVSPSSGE